MRWGLVMAQQYVAYSPSDLHDLCIGFLKEPPGATIQLTLQLYKSLSGTDIKPRDDNFWHCELERLYAAWVHAIRDAHQLLAPSEDGAMLPASTLIFTMDVTRPPMPQRGGANFMIYEARGVMRITNTLHASFRDRGALECTIVRAPCWCVLRETEKHILLLKGQSWPVSRTSHVEWAGARFDAQSDCLRLSKDQGRGMHWDHVNGTDPAGRCGDACCENVIRQL